MVRFHGNFVASLKFRPGFEPSAVFVRSLTRDGVARTLRSAFVGRPRRTDIGFAGGERGELLRSERVDVAGSRNPAEVLICGNAGIFDHQGRG